jgi:hypothetical protein
MLGVDFNGFHRSLLSIKSILATRAVMARGASLLALLALLAGCAPPTGTAEELAPAGRDFLQRLRWKDYQGASAYLLPEHRQQFLGSFSAEELLHITDVQLEGVENAAAGQAVTWAVLEYYRLPSLSVRKFRLQLDWVYIGGKRLQPGSWLLSTPFPDIP